MKRLGVRPLIGGRPNLADSRYRAANLPTPPIPSTPAPTRTPPRDGAGVTPTAVTPSGAGLSWDVEDQALAERRCPWCVWMPPGQDPDHLLRHVVMHARVWENDSRTSERAQRALQAKVRAFARDVTVRAEGVLAGG